MRRLLWKPIVLLLLLGACVGPGGLSGGLTAGQSMAIACRGYSVGLSTIASYRAALTVEEVAAVDLAIVVISPICRAAAVGEIEDYALALRTVRAHLRRMLILEQEIAG